jgi:ABC-type glutathione transport system ATPase component
VWTSLIVADEPTASLDPETQREILSLFRDLRQKFNLSMIWITHNPLLLDGFADRVLDEAAPGSYGFRTDR